VAATTRRCPAAAGPIPGRSVPPGQAWGVLSEGHLPANRRPAVPTRVHQSGGQPTHAAPARRADLRARPPPASRPWVDHHNHDHGRGAQASALTLTAVPTSERPPRRQRGGSRRPSPARWRTAGRPSSPWKATYQVGPLAARIPMSCKVATGTRNTPNRKATRTQPERPAPTPHHADPQQRDKPRDRGQEADLRRAAVASRQPQRLVVDRWGGRKDDQQARPGKQEEAKNQHLGPVDHRAWRLAGTTR
jgi:hypothetical protein